MALLSLRFVFKQPLRSMEGFAKSLVPKMKMDLEVPDYSTLSLKIHEMNIQLPLLTKSDAGNVISHDSTDLKRSMFKVNGTAKNTSRETIVNGLRGISGN